MKRGKIESSILGFAYLNVITQIVIKLTNNTGKRTMAGKNQHVVKHQDGWAVKGAGNSKATKVTSAQGEAIQVAQGIARNQQSDTKVHGVNGRIRAGNSYGNDPCPARDKK